MTLPRKARFFWVYPLAVWLFVTADASDASLRLGAIVACLGEALRLWANSYVGHRKVNATQQGRHDPKIGHLITAGPYACVRNPLYVGTFIIGLGFCVAVRNLWAAAGGLLLLAVIYRGKVQEEEAVIQQEWGEAFDAYCQAVPRWFPTFRRPSHRYGDWSWQGIIASKEFKTVVWVTVGFLALYFQTVWRQERALFSGPEKTTQLTLLCVGVALIAGDLLFEGLRVLRRFSSKTHPTSGAAA